MGNSGVERFGVGGTGKGGPYRAGMLVVVLSVPKELQRRKDLEGQVVKVVGAVGMGSGAVELVTVMGERVRLTTKFIRLALPEEIEEARERTKANQPGMVVLVVMRDMNTHWFNSLSAAAEWGRLKDVFVYIVKYADGRFLGYNPSGKAHFLTDSEKKLLADAQLSQ